MLITTNKEIVSEYRDDDLQRYVYINRFKDHDNVVWWENTYVIQEETLNIELYRYEQHAENAAEDFVLGARQ